MEIIHYYNGTTTIHLDMLKRMLWVLCILAHSCYEASMSMCALISVLIKIAHINKIKLLQQRMIRPSPDDPIAADTAHCVALRQITAQRLGPSSPSPVTLCVVGIGCT